MHHRVEVRIVRIFNTYGPRMHEEDGRVVSNFINQALRERPLTIYLNAQEIVTAMTIVNDAPSAPEVNHLCPSMT